MLMQNLQLQAKSIMVFSTVAYCNGLFGVLGIKGQVGISHDRVQQVLNPLTPKSDLHVNSLINFNETSVRQVLRMKIIISLRGVISI